MNGKISITTDEHRYIWVSKEHTYGSNCYCHLCSALRDGVAKDEIEIWNHDQTQQLVLPRPKDIETK